MIPDGASLMIGGFKHARLVRKVIAGHIGLNAETQRQMMARKLEVELVPRGTLTHRSGRGASARSRRDPRPGGGYLGANA
jgi:acyl CoA:acetate/3-ketoacid CoA transferase alpha subunit